MTWVEKLSKMKYNGKKEWRNGMARVRMQDIANQVGVSAVTVHNALAGRKGVSEEVRVRILDKAREMGYLFENMEHMSLQEHRRGHLGEISGGLYHVLLEDLYGDRHGGA